MSKEVFVALVGVVVAAIGLVGTVIKVFGRDILEWIKARRADSAGEVLSNESARSGRSAETKPPLAGQRDTEKDRDAARGAARDALGTLATDCEAFLTAVQHKAGSPAALEAWARALNDLVQWSEARSGVIRFRPRDKKLATVTYVLSKNGRNFWQAYPEGEGGASFYCYVDPPLRKEVKRAFDTLRGSDSGNTIPTLRFPDLIPDATREKLKELLGQVLAKLTSA